MCCGSHATAGHPIELQPFLSLSLYFIHNITREDFFVHGRSSWLRQQTCSSLQNVDSIKWNGEPNLYKRRSGELKNTNNEVLSLSEKRRLSWTWKLVCYLHIRLYSVLHGWLHSLVGFIKKRKVPLCMSRWTMLFFPPELCWIFYS